MAGKKNNTRAMWVRIMCVALAFLMVSSIFAAILALL